MMIKDVTPTNSHFLQNIAPGKENAKRKIYYIKAAINIGEHYEQITYDRFS